MIIDLVKGEKPQLQILKNILVNYNFVVDEIDAQEIEKIAISSTKIRNSINEGDLKTTENIFRKIF